MTARALLNTDVEVEAVLSSMKMPADALAALVPGDQLELDTQGAAAEMTVRLMADGETIAVASLALDGDRLIATIINNGPGNAGRRIDQWKQSKAKTTA